MFRLAVCIHTVQLQSHRLPNESVHSDTLRERGDNSSLYSCERRRGRSLVSGVRLYDYISYLHSLRL